MLSEGLLASIDAIGDIVREDAELNNSTSDVGYAECMYELSLIGDHLRSTMGYVENRLEAIDNPPTI
jgi:hypothetical protein